MWFRHALIYTMPPLFRVIKSENEHQKKLQREEQMNIAYRNHKIAENAAADKMSTDAHNKQMAAEQPKRMVMKPFAIIKRTMANLINPKKPKTPKTK